MVKWPENCINVDKDRLLTREEYGYYWVWTPATDEALVVRKTEGCVFYNTSVYVKIQETPPETPEPIKVLADGWYVMMGKLGRAKYVLEKRGDATYDLDKVYCGSIHLFDVVSGPVDFGKGVKNG